MSGFLGLNDCSCPPFDPYLEAQNQRIIEWNASQHPQSAADSGLFEKYWDPATPVRVDSGAAIAARSPRVPRADQSIVNNGHGSSGLAHNPIANYSNGRQGPPVPGYNMHVPALARLGYVEKEINGVVMWVPKNAH